MANEKRKTIYDSLELKVFSDDIYSYRDKAKQSLCFSLMPNNPYMQEMLRGEEKRREQNRDEIHNRQNGYIK